MRVLRLHRWDLTPGEAIRLQRELADRVSTVSTLKSPIRLAAGVDVSSSKFSPRLFCGIVVYDLEERRMVERIGGEATALCPYIPGLLSFREAPGLLEAFERLVSTPDVILVDGAGYAHPRRLGLAAHLGILLDHPTIGCAKSRLCGDYREPGRRRGSSCRLSLDGETIGRVVRSRDDVKPLFVSIGHRISLDDAVRVTLRCCDAYRIPTPIRLAHAFVNDLRASRSTKRRGQAPTSPLQRSS